VTVPTEDASSRSRVGLGEVIEVAQDEHRALSRRQPAQVLEEVLGQGNAVGAVVVQPLGTTLLLTSRQRRWRYRLTDSRASTYLTYGSGRSWMCAHFGRDSSGTGCPTLPA
jgi:hypothetical protein